MNTTVKQKALDYIMYMILGSYFIKAECLSPLKEKQLLLCYKDLKPADQLELEEKCIRYVEKFRKAVPEEFWEQTVQVHIKGRYANVIEFHGDKQILCARTCFDRKKPCFRISLLTKKEERKEKKEKKSRPLAKAA